MASGCETLHLNAPRANADGDWIVDGASIGRERVIDVSVQPPLERMWLHNANAGFGTGSPLLFNGAVIVGNRRGELHGVDIETGNAIGVKRIGESIEGSLLIHHGVAFATHAWGKYSITAFDLTKGSVIWRQKGIPYEVAPVQVSGRLVALDVEGNLRSFNMDTGEEEWVAELGEEAISRASPLLLADGNLFIVSESGRGFFIDPVDGRVLWVITLGNPVYASPASNGNQILIPTTRGRLFSVSSIDGSVKWVFAESNSAVKFASPATDGSVIYMGASNGTLYAIDAQDGTSIWQFNGPDAITAAPLITREHVYFGTMGRMLYGLERGSGKMAWQEKLKGRIKSALAAREGELIVLTEPRYIYGFREEEHDVASL